MWRWNFFKPYELKKWDHYWQKINFKGWKKWKICSTHLTRSGGDPLLPLCDRWNNTLHMIMSYDYDYVFCMHIHIWKHKRPFLLYIIPRFRSIPSEVLFLGSLRHPGSREYWYWHALCCFYGVTIKYSRAVLQSWLGIGLGRSIIV